MTFIFSFIFIELVIERNFEKSMFIKGRKKEKLRRIFFTNREGFDRAKYTKESLINKSHQLLIYADDVDTTAVLLTGNKSQHKSLAKCLMTATKKSG